jgi:hypothetical protein
LVLTELSTPTLEKIELLDIVSAGKGRTLFPATEVEGVWCPDAVGDLLLDPVAFFARQA